MDFHNWVIQRLLRLLGTPADGQVVKFNAESDQFVIADEAAVAASPITSEMIAAADEGDVPTVDDEGGIVFQPVSIANEVVLRLTEDQLNTDDTSTPENVTGIVFALGANEVVSVEGLFLAADTDEYNASSFKWDVPAGCTYLGKASTPYDEAEWAFDLDGEGSALVGEVTPNGGENPNSPIKFWLVFQNAATPGNAQLVFTNRAEADIEGGIREGSYVKVRR